MSETIGSFFPKARGDGLIVEDVFDELVVYDVETHQAHALAPLTAAIWRHCDG